MAEQLGRPRDVAVREQFADPGGGHAPLSERGDVVDDHDLEAVGRRRLTQEGDVAAALVTEPEVLADENGAGVEVLHENAADEVLRRLRGELGVEAQHEARVDAGLLEQVELLLETHERVGAHLRRDNRERVPVERDDDALQVALGRDSLELADDRAVSGVHAVELADRDGGGAEVGGNPVNVADADHRASSVRAVRRSQIMPSTGSTSGMNR